MNQMAMQQKISELLPNLRFMHVIPAEDLVPPCLSMNPPPPQADNVATDDDDEAVNLDDYMFTFLIFLFNC